MNSDILFEYINHVLHQNTIYIYIYIYICICVCVCICMHILTRNAITGMVSGMASNTKHSK